MDITFDFWNRLAIRLVKCPDCPYQFVAEEGQAKFRCPKCEKSYCLNCRVQYHEQMSCREYQLVANQKDNAFNQLAKS